MSLRSLAHIEPHRVKEQFARSTTLEVQSIDLPLPPSTNSLYQNVKGKGRVRTMGYNAWLIAAGKVITSQRVKAYDVPVQVCVYLEDSPKTEGDADNRIKACLDLLVKHRVIAGDCKLHVRRACAEWSPETKGCRVSIRPAPGHGGAE